MYIHMLYIYGVLLPRADSGELALRRRMPRIPEYKVM